MVRRLRAATCTALAVSRVGYPVPASVHRVGQSIERSRFIATVTHAPTAGEARAFIDAVRAEFPDATHNCWAYVCGPPGSTAVVGMSDAGEPHGTAGRPMLDVLLYSAVGEIAAVVTRYYGGVKLGKGGLVRAYGGAVQHALEAMPRVEKIERIRITITVDYTDIEPLRRLLDELGGDVEREEYAADVMYDVAMPVHSVEALREMLMDRTAGRARMMFNENGA